MTARQSTTLRFAAALADRTAGLPSAYYDVSPHHPDTLRLDVFGAAAFEAWRETLAAPAADVVLEDTPGSMRLRVEGVVPGGITVRLTGHCAPACAGGAR